MRWLRPSSVVTRTLSIRRNGVYAGQGLYGYAEVDVNVEPNSVRSRDPDTGDPIIITVEDPDTPIDPDDPRPAGPGRLVVEDVAPPTRIVTLTDPPGGPFLPGEAIDYAGIRVQAQTSSGAPWSGFEDGVVPFGELIFPHARVEAAFPDCREVAASEILSRGKLSNSGLFARGIDPSFEEYYADGVAEQAKGVVNDFTYWLRRYEKLGYNIAVRRATKFYVADTMDHYSSAGMWDGIWEAMDDDDFARYNTFRLGGTVFLAWIYFDYPYKETLYAQFAVRATIAFDAFETPQFRITKLELVRPTRYTKHIFQGVEKTGSLYTDTRLTNHVICSLDDFVGNINAYIPPDVDAATVGENDIPIYLATSELDCGVAQPVRFSVVGHAAASAANGVHREYRFSGGRVALSYEGSAIYYVVAAREPGSFTVTTEEYTHETPQTTDEQGNTVTGDEVITLAGTSSETDALDRSYTYAGLTVRYAAGAIPTDAPVARVRPDTAAAEEPFYSHAAAIAWTVVYGSIPGETVAVPVRWPSPEGEEVLETTCNVRVATPATAQT